MKLGRNRATVRKSRRASIIENLEPRVLYSADVIPGLSPDTLPVTGDISPGFAPTWEQRGVVSTIEEKATDFNVELDLVAELSRSGSALASFLTESKLPEPDSLRAPEPDAEIEAPDSVAKETSSPAEPWSPAPDADAGTGDHTASSGAPLAPASEIVAFDSPGQLAVLDETVSTDELVFIDVRTPDYLDLVDDLERSNPDIVFEYVLLDSDEDGLKKITDTLMQYESITSVHIVSHGSDGEVQLGAVTLNDKLLATRGDEVSLWSNHLSQDADILFYGCDLAATIDGMALVDDIASLSGADIASSDDVTGHEDLGGDWEFEYTVGDIESDIVFSLDAQHNWFGTLATVTVTTLDDVVDGDTSSVDALIANSGADGVISLREAIIAANRADTADVIQLGSGIHTLSIAGAGDAGGDLDINRDVQIVGMADGSSVVDGSGLTGERVFSVVNNDATFQHLTITGGNVTGNGGGLDVGNTSTVVLDHVVVSGNSATGNGGGILSGGMLTVTNSTISSNMSDSRGGGIAASNGQIQLDTVTVSNNTALNDGGGVRVINGGPHEFTNVTVSGNHSDINGGGVAVGQGGTIGNFHRVTITDNTADGRGGGIYNTNSQGVANVTESLVSGNEAPDGKDGHGAINDDGISIIGENPGLLLGPLADNGEVVETHALLPGSVGIGDDGSILLGVMQDPVDSPAAGSFLDLSSSVEINTDGNDAYLVAADGSAVLGGRGSLTVEAIFSSTQGGTAGLLSYAGAANNHFGNDFHIRYDSEQNELSFYVDGDQIDAVLANGFSLFDGRLHSVALSWDNANGDWTIYVDGQAIDSGNGVATGATLDTGGTLLLGQDQDANGSDFGPNQVFSGAFFDVRVWDHVRTNSEIAEDHQQKLNPNISHNGLIANWQFDGFDGTEVVDIVGGNNLTVDHVAEPGFTPNIPCLLYTSPSPRDGLLSRMPSSA